MLIETYDEEESNEKIYAIDKRKVVLKESIDDLKEYKDKLKRMLEGKSESEAPSPGTGPSQDPNPDPAISIWSQREIDAS